MSLVLNIDTAVTSASVALARNGQHIHMRANEQTREHAGWLHDNIKKLLADAGTTLRSIDAVAVSNGPGSYTGLRIGLSAAKGLCYAANLPLIAVGTLEVMAAATINQVSGKLVHKNTLISPMIDARRMEVYTAVYDRHLAQVSAPVAMILDSASYHEWLDQHSIIFSGNGMLKWKSLCTHHHAVFADHVNATAMDMAGLSYEYYTEKRFADLSYAEPLYLKEFHTPARK